jgi:hypothetical protein
LTVVRGAALARELGFDPRGVADQHDLGRRFAASARGTHGMHRDLEARRAITPQCVGDDPPPAISLRRPSSR